MAPWKRKIVEWLGLEMPLPPVEFTTALLRLAPGDIPVLMIQRSLELYEIERIKKDFKLFVQRHGHKDCPPVIVLESGARIGVIRNVSCLPTLPTA